MSWVCVFEVTAVHGLKGALKAKRYLEDFSFVEYVKAESRQELYQLESIVRLRNNMVKLQVKEIDSIEKAQQFVGQKLFIERKNFPDLAEGYYYIDLIGCELIAQSGEKYGTITNIYNFGAEDIIEFMCLKSNTFKMLPFTKEIFTEVNLVNKKVILNLPFDINEL